MCVKRMACVGLPLCVHSSLLVFVTASWNVKYHFKHTFYIYSGTILLVYISHVFIIAKESLCCCCHTQTLIYFCDSTNISVVSLWLLIVPLKCSTLDNYKMLKGCAIDSKWQYFTVYSFFLNVLILFHIIILILPLMCIIMLPLF